MTNVYKTNMRVYLITILIPQHSNIRQGLYYIIQFPNMIYYNVPNLLQSYIGFSNISLHYEVQIQKIESVLQNINHVVGSAVKLWKRICTYVWKKVAFKTWKNYINSC